MVVTNVKGLAEIHREATEQLEFLLQRKINTNEARRRIEYVKALLDSAEEIICKETKKIKGDMTCAELAEIGELQKKGAKKKCKI
jgi:hypothetical protein